MPNDFSTDGNCKALWRFESGANFKLDSKGGNDLSSYPASTPDEDAVTFKEGSQSALFVVANTDRMWILDADLDAGFPLKSGETNKTISLAFWLRMTSLPPSAGNERRVFTKIATNNNSIVVSVYNDAGTSKMFLGLASDGTVATYTRYFHASALAIDTWYHVGVTYQASDDTYRIRIWDDTAGAILGTDATGTSEDIFPGTANTYLGWTTQLLTQDGNLDELVVFDDVLSIAEIDQIRAGTYGGGPPPPAAGKFGSLSAKRHPPKQTVGLYTEL